MTRRSLVVCILLLAAALGIALFANYTARSARPADAAFRKESSESNSAGSAKPASVATAPLAAPSALPWRTTFMAELHSAHLRESFDRLAASTDPTAMYYAGRIAELCAIFGEELYPRTVKKIEGSTADAPSTKALRLRIAEKQRARCVGMTTQEFGFGAKLASDAGRTGAALGFASTVHTMRANNVDDFASKARSAAYSMDPEIIREIAMFYASRSDAKIGEAAFTVDDGVRVARDEMRDAWLLVSCEAGAGCDEDDSWFVGQCVVFARCGDGSLESLLLSGDGERRERVLAAREAILKGLATRNWPDGFWKR